MADTIGLMGLLSLCTLGTLYTLGGTRLWLRYVDDTFVVWPHGQEKLDSFHKHLNTQHRNIKFTVEHEKENKLAFLDVQVTRTTTNRLTTSVYCKPTHTNRYIPFHSHHHRMTITGVLRCMRDRANRIFDFTSKQQELQHLQAVFQVNGFPADLVRKMLSHQTCPTLPEPMHKGSTEPLRIISLPYSRGLSKKIERVYAPLGVKAAFKPMKMLRQTLMKVKNSIPEERKGRWSMQSPARNAT